MNKDERIILIITSTASKRSAEELSDQLLQKRLAACIQIESRIGSRYVWKGEIIKTDECRMLIKTSESQWIAIKELLEKSHPYDTPGIIKVPITGSSAAYQEWILSATENPE